MDEPRHLFIDGYNILYAWQWLTGRENAAGSLETARARLVEAVRPIHDVERIAITLVFDGRETTGGQDRSATEPGFSVIFAPAGKTADNVIEALVAAASAPAQCVVATADALERETVSAAGGACLSPGDLLAWCARCRTRASQSITRRSEQSRASWGNKLPL